MISSTHHPIRRGPTHAYYIESIGMQLPRKYLMLVPLLPNTISDISIFLQSSACERTQSKAFLQVRPIPHAPCSDPL
jgi:hypothetical protein